ncbi:MAG TPA: hypothetical protein DCX06_04925, partial [Opitutae bacterium]|nr:hypothetical protein [Opitutae bacterium]
MEEAMNGFRMKNSTLIGTLALLLCLGVIVGGVWVYQESFVDFEHAKAVEGRAALQSEDMYGV